MVEETGVASRRLNILLVMADQMSPMAMPSYGHRLTQTPHMAALANTGVVFDNAYCNSPLCSPSRAAFMSGRLPSATQAFDNAAEFRADIPTFAHYLRHAGYRTTLAGKMHFCGPDQMHGFEERLTTDIYPADYGWTPDWSRPKHRPHWYHNMSSVTDAGLCVRTNQLDYDDEVTFAAERAIYDAARGRDERPFCMVVSLTHPHDPFAIPAKYWDLYRDADIELPRVAIADWQMDPHSRRLRDVCDMGASEITERQIRDARHAYYGAISYVDENVGRLMAALKATRLDEDTVVIVTSDHGEMLGERGLWYKMSFFEGAARVPLIVNAPKHFAPRRVTNAVSLIDLLPTLVDIAHDGQPPGYATEIDGRSLLPHLANGEGHDEVVGEYLAEGSLAPLVMLRQGPWKFIHSPVDPDQLYRLDEDPDELTNLAESNTHAATLADFRRQVAQRWDLNALDRAVRDSQRRRLLVSDALGIGAQTAWDFQPFRDASLQYIRNRADLDDLEASARYPRVRPIA